MNSGADFIAVVRLSNKANETLARPGETCQRVPTSSLPSLLRAGRIRPAGAVLDVDPEPEPAAEAPEIVAPAEALQAEALPDYRRGRRRGSRQNEGE